MDFGDFFEPEPSDLDRDAAKPTCPRCHLILPISGECC